MQRQDDARGAVDEFVIEGNWWIHGHEETARFGTLTSNAEGDLSLVIKIPQSVTPDEVVERFPGIASTDILNRVIVGRDADNKAVTLFGCHALPTIATGLLTYDIDALAAVHGLEIGSWTEKCIHAASFDVDQLHGWLGGKLVETVTIPNEASAIRPAAADDIVVDASPNLQLRVHRFVASSSSLTEYRLRAQPRVWLHFKTAQSVSDVSDRWRSWVTNLFSLLVGESVYCRRTELYKSDPWAKKFKGIPTDGVLIRNGRRPCPTKPLHAVRMLAPYPEIAERFSRVVREWHRVASKLEPVVDLFSTVAFHSHLHVEAAFLFLVQALEVYHARLFDSSALPKEEHRRRVKAVTESVPFELRVWAESKLRPANYKYLDERLTEIFERHQSEAARLFDNLSELPEKIRLTRNHLTHYNSKDRSPKYLNEVQLNKVFWYLKVFIWVCLLKEIGVPSKGIERLMRRHEAVTFINL